MKLTLSLKRRSCPSASLNSKSARPANNWRFAVLLMSPMMMLASAFGANCDPDASPDACRPVGLEANISLSPRGISLTWALFDTPLPDKAQVIRSPAFPKSVGNPAVITGNSPGYFDSTATPGQAYNYTVCTVYQNTFCSNTVIQGLPGTVRPPAPPSPPSGLSVTDTSRWTSARHWQQSLSLHWKAGSGFPSYTIFTGHDWGRIDNIVPGASTFVIADPRLLQVNAVYQFRVCGASNSSNLSNCTNLVTINAPHVPLPKAPVSINAFAQGPNDVRLSWAPGDDNVSAWFDAERLDVDRITAAGGSGKGTFWQALQPRIATGQRAFLVDNLQTGNGGPRHIPLAPATPLTYRVCAGNQSGTTCSDPTQAKASKVAPIAPH